MNLWVYKLRVSEFVRKGFVGLKFLGFRVFAFVNFEALESVGS